MTLDEIRLTNFKNIASAHLRLSPKLNCFLGDNGMGKSNLVDAIHYLSVCKSMTGAPDKMLVRRGELFAMMQGVYTRHQAREEVTVGFAEGKRKTVKRSGKEYQRLSAHIGVFPAVLVAPSDMDLVNGTGEERRRFIDMALSQGDARYLAALSRYNQALQQRNRLLRDGVADPNLFLALETAMDAAAAYITASRRRHIDRLAEIHRRYYARIAGPGAETTGLDYVQWGTDAPADSLMDVLEANRQRDAILRHTSAGPHRDDIVFSLDGMPLRRTGSQGQQKTFTIALRLAQYEFLAEYSGVKPLLLLDDIFDKLDSRRVEAIIGVVRQPDFGQIFITDTNRKHLDEIVSHMPSDHALWLVRDGAFTAITDHAAAEDGDR